MNTDWITPVSNGLGLVVLLFFHALVVAGRSSLIRLRLSLFRDELLSEERVRDWHRGFVEKGDSFDRVLVFLQLLFTFAYAFEVIQLVRWISSLEVLGSFGANVAAVVLAILLIVVFYILGNVAPRSWAYRRPLDAFLRSAAPLRILNLLVGWLVRILDGFAAPFTGSREPSALGGLEALEIERQVEEKTGSASIGVTRVIVRNALKMRELEVQDILLPRNQVQYFDIADGNAFNLDLARKTGHTRFPVCEGNLDHCIGIIHIKDVFRVHKPAEQLDFRRMRRPILRVKPEDKLEDTLMRLLRNKMHMALVADEFGGVTGLVTLEQILEELVGDIQDEFDYEEALIKPVADGVFVVSGLTALHDLEEELEVAFEGMDTEGVTTFGGLITSELGRIPQPREEFDLPPLQVAITEADEKRVIAARVRVMRATDEEVPAGEGI